MNFPADSTTPRTALVVAERGSDWTPWVEQFRRETPDVVVLMQEPDEKVAAFATRVGARVGELRLCGGRLENAVIVSGGRTDHDIVSARSASIRAIVSPMVEAAGGKLYLSSGGSDRFTMLGIATSVAPMVRGTGVRLLPVQEVPLAA